MPITDVRTMDQKIADAAHTQQWETWRASRTVCASVPDPTAQLEMLECLGLLGVTEPA